MSKFGYLQPEQESESLFESEDEFRQPKKETSSTRYSESTKSKIQQEYESISCSDVLQSVNFKWRRKQQNKQSAKKCREKKKEKIQQLENKEKRLQEQLEKILEEHSKLKIDVQKYISGTNTVRDLLIQPNIFHNIGRTQSYDRLNKILNEDDIMDQDQINLILDNLKNRANTTGTQRKGKINYIFKQIIHISFPAVYRYLMWTADANIGYFGQPYNGSGWMSATYETLALNQSQKSLLKGKKNGLIRQFKIFSQLIQQMKQKKQKLEKESSKLELLIEEMRLMLTPTQSARLLTFIQNNKYRQQIDVWVKRNMSKFQQSAVLEDPGPIKRPKFTSQEPRT